MNHKQQLLRGLWVGLGFKFRVYKLGSPVAPLIISVPFFRLSGFNKRTQNKKGKMVLLGNLVIRFGVLKEASFGRQGAPACQPQKRSQANPPKGF